MYVVQIRPALACAAILAVVLTGCSPSRSEYVALAEAGTIFNRAMGEFASDVVPSIARANAEALLESSIHQTTSTKPENLLLQSAKREEEALDQMRRVLKSSNLLARYYGTLAVLATTATPAQIETGLSSFNDAFTDLATVLEINTAQLAPLQGLPALGGWIANQAVDAALRREFAARGPLLLAFHARQNELIGEITGPKKIRESVAQRAARERIVDQPFIAGTIAGRKEQDIWVADYVDAATRGLLITGLDSVTVASDELADAFKTMLSGGGSIARLDAAVAQLRQAVVVFAKFRSAT